MKFKAKKIMKMKQYLKLEFEDPVIISTRVYPQQATTGTVEVVIVINVR